jgi:toxin ParE1/3/4
MPSPRPRRAEPGVSRFRLTVRAQQNLQAIFEFSVEWFGERQAQKYQAGMLACFELLAENPKLGRLSPAIRPGMRRHEHGSHVVIYREEAEAGIVIGAVLHKRQLLALKL